MLLLLLRGGGVEWAMRGPNGLTLTHTSAVAASVDYKRYNCSGSNGAR